MKQSMPHLIPKPLGALMWLAALGMTLMAQTATPGQSLAWVHSTADAEFVTRFELNYDAGGYTSVGRVAHPTLANTFYAPLPALLSGTHTVIGRACNVNGCGLDSAPFSFSMVAGVPTVISPGSFMIITTP